MLISQSVNKTYTDNSYPLRHWQIGQADFGTALNLQTKKPPLKQRGLFE
jgi:hypothetical protein